MTTQRTRALVSLAAGMTVMLALGACAPSRSGLNAAEPVADPPTIRFDNDAREHVYVYLIGERREWRLGRVEAGAMTTLRIPEEAFAERPGFMKLAVITGQPVTPRAARDARGAFTIAQPTSVILSYEWRFAQGQVLQEWRRKPPVDAGTPRRL